MLKTYFNFLKPSPDSVGKHKRPNGDATRSNVTNVLCSSIPVTSSEGALYLLLVQLAQLRRRSRRAAMEVNRDEAERCVDIATAALTSDQPEKAQRFLEKAQRLFPTEKAKGELKWPSWRVKGALRR